LRVIKDYSKREKEFKNLLLSSRSTTPSEFSDSSDSSESHKSPSRLSINVPSINVPSINVPSYKQPIDNTQPLTLIVPPLSTLVTRPSAKRSSAK